MMSTVYKIAELDQIYHLTLQVVEWVDLFTRKPYRDLLIQKLAFCQQNKSLEIFAYVIMSNHIHVLAKNHTRKLIETIRDFNSINAIERFLLHCDSENPRNSPSFICHLMGELPDFLLRG